MSFLSRLAILMLVVGTAQAQSDRVGSWEIGGSMLDFSSVDVQALNGSSLRVDDSVGFGFSGAYNFNNRFAIGLDMTYTRPDYQARLVPDGGGSVEDISAELDVDIIHFKGIFNLLDNEWTPYIEFGGGWTYVDSNIVSGVSEPVCWWDPWWGYVCERFVDTYTDTRTSFAYTVGVRWDINETFVIRGGWGSMEVDTNRAAEDIEIDTIQLTFGYKF